MVMILSWTWYSLLILPSAGLRINQGIMKISKILNLDYKHSIMVLPDITEDKCDALTSLFAMMVCSLFRLPEIVTATIMEDCKIS
jgi:hypothetical protein